MKDVLTTLIKLVIHRALNVFCQFAKLLPVKNNRIVCISHRHGAQYSDSPKYITEYLLEHFGDKYEIIWVFDCPDMFKELEKRGIKIIKFNSWKDYYYSNTAKVYITNLFGPYPNVIKRKDRIIIETTHGVAYKHLVFNNNSSQNEDAIFGKMIYTYKMNKVDYALSGNRITTDLVYRDNLGYRGNVIEEGLPRNDIFFKKNYDIKRKVMSSFGIPEWKRIVILMPTWRKDNSRKIFEIDYQRIINSLKEKDGCEWVFLIRLHHLSKVDLTEIIKKNNGSVIDASKYSDPQELLLASDMLITDYSSVVWDFALQRKPILVYTPDLASYAERQGFNVPPEEWMLYEANTEDELYKLIDDNDIDVIAKASEKHLDKFGSFETGEATKRICERIDKYCNSIYPNDKSVFMKEER